VAEFTRREGDGAADVRRILGVPTLACYGQPGSSWGPQTLAALKPIGVAPHEVACYVDEGDHVGIDGQPFWYAGALNVYHMAPNYTRMDLHDPAAVEPAKKKVSEITARLQAGGGGIISIYYHPCEWVHREFWDGVNFAHGANPPREQWKPPRQRTTEETETAFKRFGQYVDHIRGIAGVNWVTASDLPLLYPDKVRTEGATESDLSELALSIRKNIGKGLDFQRMGNRVFSVADQFELLTVAVNAVSNGQQLHFPLRAAGLFGPDSAPPETATISKLDWPAFRDAARDVLEFIQTEHRVPARVFVGAELVAPADFLVAMAVVFESYRHGGNRPVAQASELSHGVRILPERYVAKDTPELFGWVIHKEGFHAPKVMQMARLQAWTLKPAVRAVSDR
jgi:hypothetical protein